MPRHLILASLPRLSTPWGLALAPARPPSAVLGAILLLASIGAPRSAAQAGTAAVPLCAGLSLVTAIAKPEGDYESIKTVTAVGESGVQIAYSAQVPNGHGGLRLFKVRRTVLRRDLADATLYMHYFHPEAAVTFAGSTAIGTSSAVLRALKTTGTATLQIVQGTYSAASPNRAIHPNVYEFMQPYALRRAGSSPPKMSVLVNDVPRELPVIHAQGDYRGDKADFYFLDDERNPLALSYRFQSKERVVEADGLQVVKISYHCSRSPAQPASDRIAQLERALREDRRAIVYDVYFDFNRDVIRQESEPTMQEIAAVLRRNPEWRLSIEGHTDAVASDRYNQGLSARRAAAVKTALTGRLGIAPNRLSTVGVGEARPKDRNDTVEGRARNRRVELVRL